MQAISTPSSFALAGGSSLGRNQKHAARRGAKAGAASRAALRAPLAGPREDAGVPAWAHRPHPREKPSSRDPKNENARGPRPEVFFDRSVLYTMTTSEIPGHKRGLARGAKLINFHVSVGSRRPVQGPAPKR